MLHHVANQVLEDHAPPLPNATSPRSDAVPATWKSAAQASHVRQSAVRW